MLASGSVRAKDGQCCTARQSWTSLAGNICRGRPVFSGSIVAMRQGIGPCSCWEWPTTMASRCADGLACSDSWSTTFLYRRHGPIGCGAMLRNAPTSRLRSKPNVAYEVTQLQVITCVAKRGDPSSCRNSFSKQRAAASSGLEYGRSNFKGACEYLKQMYPGLWRGFVRQLSNGPKRTGFNKLLFADLCKDCCKYLGSGFGDGDDGMPEKERQLLRTIRGKPQRSRPGRVPLLSP